MMGKIKLRFDLKHDFKSFSPVVSGFDLKTSGIDFRGGDLILFSSYFGDSIYPNVRFISKPDAFKILA